MLAVFITANFLLVAIVPHPLCWELIYRFMIYPWTKALIIQTKKILFVSFLKI